MQTARAPDLESNERPGSTRMLKAMWALVVVSCCAALAAFACVYANLTLAAEIANANPTCSGDGLPRMIGQLHTVWLAWGAAGLLSWSCAFVARVIASVSTPGARLATGAILLLSTSVLIGLAGSVFLFQVGRYSSCFG